MKSSDEIKKGLECCGGDCFNGNEDCPYDKDDLKENISCIRWMAKDALAYIEQLEQRLVQAEEDIKHLLIISNNQRSCAYCSRYPGKCDLCETDAEWRGAEEDTE